MPRAHFGGDSATRVAQEVAIIKSALNFDKSVCVCGCVCVDTHTPTNTPPTPPQTHNMTEVAVIKSAKAPLTQIPRLLSN